MAAKSTVKKEIKKTPVKKRTAKASVNKVIIREPAEKITTPSQNKPNLSKSKSHPWLYTALIILLLLIIGGVVFRRQFVVALVNGQPIFRYHFVKALEAQAGKEILDQLVTEQLIKAAAQEKSLTVTPEELDKEVATITESLKSRGMDINEALSQQGLDLNKFKEQITLKLLVTRLAAADITVSDEEVADYMEKNKTSLPQGKDAPENIKELVKEQMLQGKQQESIQTWLTESKNKATIQYW